MSKPKSTASDAETDACLAGNPAGAVSPIERNFEELIDRHLEEMGHVTPVAIAGKAAAERHGSRGGIDASRRTRIHISIFERMRRTVRPSPPLLRLLIGASLSLVIWLSVLAYAIGVDPTKPFVELAHIRMENALALACVFWLGTSALLMRAAWQIWQGTRRYREFPPWKPALLLPPSIIRGIDAEHSGRLCLRLGFGLMLVSVAVVAVTISRIVW